MLRIFIPFIFFLFQCYASISSTESSASSSFFSSISKDYGLFNRNSNIFSTFPYYFSGICKFDNLSISALRVISIEKNFDIILVENPKTFPKNISLKLESGIVLEKMTCNTEISIFLNEMLKRTFNDQDSNNNVLRIYRFDKIKLHVLKYSYKNLEDFTAFSQKGKQDQIESININLSLESHSSLIPYIYIKLESGNVPFEIPRIISSNPNHLAQKCDSDNPKTCHISNVHGIDFSLQFFNVFEKKSLISKEKGEWILSDLPNKTSINDLMNLFEKRQSEKLEKPQKFEFAIVPKDIISPREFPNEIIASKITMTKGNFREYALLAINEFLSSSHAIQICDLGSMILFTCYNISKNFIPLSSSASSSLSSFSNIKIQKNNNFHPGNQILQNHSSHQTFPFHPQPISNSNEKFIIFQNVDSDKYSLNMKSISIMEISKIIGKIPQDQKFDFLIIKDQESIPTDIPIKDHDGEMSLGIGVYFDEIERNLRWMINFSLPKENQFLNFVFRVYRNKNEIKILKYIYEKSKISNLKNSQKESQINDMKMTIDPKSKISPSTTFVTISFSDISSRKRKEILQSSKILTLDYKPPMPSPSNSEFIDISKILNPPPKAILEHSIDLKYGLQLYRMYSSDDFEKINLSSLSNSLNPHSEFTVFDYINHLRIKDDGKIITSDHFIIPNNFSKEYRGKVKISNVLITGKWNIDNYIKFAIVNRMNSSSAIRLIMSNDKIQIISYKSVMELNHEIQTDPKSLTKEQIRKLVIQQLKIQKKKREQIEKEKEQKMKTEQAPKEQVKSQTKKSLTIKNEKEKTKESESESLKTKLSEKVSNPPPPKADSSTNEPPPQSRFKEPGKEAIKKKPIKQQKPTSRQRIHEQVNQERLNKIKKKNKKSRGDGGKSKSSNAMSSDKRRIKSTKPLPTFNFSGSTRAIKSRKPKLSVLEPLSKTADSTIKVGEPGEFGAKYVPLWRNKASNSNSASESSLESTLNNEKEREEFKNQEKTLLENKKENPKTHDGLRRLKDKENDELFLKELLAKLSIKSNESIVTNSCSSSLSSNSSTKVDSQEGNIENADFQINFIKNLLKEIDFEGDELSDEELLNLLREIDLQNKD